MGVLWILWSAVGLSLLVEISSLLPFVYKIRKESGQRPPQNDSLARSRGFKMRKIGIVLSLTILFFPAFVWADCVDLGRFTSWYLETSHAIVFYMGERPIARLEIPNCEVGPLSTIRLIKSYVCDSDEILIDGAACPKL